MPRYCLHCVCVNKLIKCHTGAKRVILPTYQLLLSEWGDVIWIDMKNYIIALRHPCITTFTYTRLQWYYPDHISLNCKALLTIMDGDITSPVSFLVILYTHCTPKLSILLIISIILLLFYHIYFLSYCIFKMPYLRHILVGSSRSSR